ncbi:MAG: MATE family efflux transporter [Draconibacterium sp.]|nr:MAG: MATE family efflux transporter [Draconibacterium sp.]
MNKKILKLSVPNIISNVTIPLLGIIDLALMGHLNSDVYIGAIALAGIIFNFIYWGFGFLRMSTSGFTARAYGENNFKQSIHILSRAILIALSGGLIVILIQHPISWISFSLIEGTQEVKNLAKEYYFIRIWAAPATLSLYVFYGWFLGMQNAKFPMIIAIAANVFNIVLSTIFVIVFKMQVVGVALGTLIGQYLGLIVAVYLFLKKYRHLLIKIERKYITDWQKLTEYFKVNGDIFIRTFCIIIVFTFFTSKSASIDNTILAVNSLLLQFLMFFSFFIDGFAYAAEALVGKYIGRKSLEKLQKSVRYLFVWGIGLALLFTLIYGIGAKPILQLLTSQQEVINAAQPFMVWVILIPIVSFSSFIWDGIYIGATASKAMRNTLLIATFAVFLPTFFLLNPYLNNHALWLSMILFMLTRGVVQTFLYKKAVLPTLST